MMDFICACAELGGEDRDVGWGRREQQDITVAPRRLETITIRSSDVVNSLAFTYRDRDKLVHTAGPWGGNGGKEEKVFSLQPNPRLILVHHAHLICTCSHADPPH